MGRDDLLYGLGITVTALGAVEIILRLKDRSESKTRFHRERWTVEHAWERFDPQSGWELAPGFASGDIQINSHGFRGQELTDADITRVMCIGDSTTFGPPEDKHPYPHTVQTVLARRRLNRSVEVINAGVCGHSTYNILFRIKRLLRFKPNVVILFTGWNDLFNESIDRYQDFRQPYSSYWHFLSGKNVNCHLLSKLREAVGYTRNEPIPLSYSIEEFVPFNFEYNLTKLLTIIKAASAKPVLLTLPKLIPDAPSKLSGKDVSKAHLPDFLEERDFKGFLRVYSAYNNIIRTVADEMDVMLFDAAALFEELKKPRGTFFEDTHHLTPEGCNVLGKFIAKSLVEKGIIK